MGHNDHEEPSEAYVRHALAFEDMEQAARDAVHRLRALDDEHAVLLLLQVLIDQQTRVEQRVIEQITGRK